MSYALIGKNPDTGELKIAVSNLPKEILDEAQRTVEAMGWTNVTRHKIKTEKKTDENHRRHR